MNAECAIQISGVRFRYPGPDAFGLQLEHLQIPAGGHVACIGPSGCGKSTLIRLIAGIRVPQTGSVRVAGHEISALGDAERRGFRSRTLGLVLQSHALLDYLSALDNIMLPYLLRSSLERDRKAQERARQLAARTGIQSVLGRKPDALSAGERQRVAICRALVTNPKVLLCDEPTANLDPARTDEILDLLFEQADAAGATIFMATHNHSTLSRFGTTFDMSTDAIVGGEP